MNLKTLRAALAAMLFIAASQSLAQAGLPHDEWTSDALPNRTFSNAAEAIAAIQSLGGRYAYAEVLREGGDSGAIDRRWFYLDAEKRTEPSLTRWRYVIAGPGDSAYHDSEEAALAAEASYSVVHPTCGLTTYSAAVEAGDSNAWVTTQTWSDHVTATNQKRNYRITITAASPGCSGSYVTVGYRSREASCPGHPHLGWNPTYRACAADGIATIRQSVFPRNCPERKNVNLVSAGDLHGNPCELRSGAKLHRESDVELPWLAFGRSYSSGDASSDLFGSGWTHSLSYRLRLRQGQPSAIVMPDGSVAKISGLALQDGSNRSVSVAGSGWDFRSDEKTYRFDSAGRLIAIAQMNGSIEFLYAASGLLERVIHSSGRSLLFRYSGIARSRGCQDFCVRGLP